MKTVYYKSGDAEWKYELEDAELDNIIRNLEDDDVDLEEMMQDSLEILRDLSEMDDEELDEDDEVDQTISVAVIWHYFNALPDGDGRIIGDVVVIENDEGDGVMVVGADEVFDE
jgi:hypothetical protein